MTHRLGRIVRIIVMLQSGLRCNALRIAAEAGVHRRTVFRDFAALRSLGFPIAFDPATGCYFLPRGSNLPSEEGLSQLLHLAQDETANAAVSHSVDSDPKQFARDKAKEELTSFDQLTWHDLLSSEHLFPEILAELITAIESQHRVLLVRTVGPASERQVILRLVELSFKGHGWQIHGVDDGGVRVQLDVESISGCLEAAPRNGRSRQGKE